MGVAVLHPQDCLRNPLKSQYPGTPVPLKTPKKSNPNPNPNPNPNHNKNRRRRSPEKSQKGSPPPTPAKNLVIGQVKILRRGEAISKPVPIPSGLGTTGRLGPDPDLVRNQVRVNRSSRSEPSVAGFYAGSVVTSPPPSSVPLPGFFTRKSLTLTVVNRDDDATSGLRRLLGLN